MGIIKTALITGGSSGIGYEMSQLFAKDGYRLFWVSKPAEELANAREAINKIYPDTEVITLQKDLAQQGAAAAVHQYTKEQGLEIDILVNNAGFGTYGQANEIPLDKELAMLNLNMVTYYHMTRLFLKDMVSKNKGKILNIASISAFQPNPRLAAYGATKSFVLQFSRAINYELKAQKSKVSITAVCPTAIKDTGFQKMAEMENTVTFENWMTVTPKQVAKDAYTALKKGREMVVPGKLLSFLHGFARHLPTRMLMKMAYSSLEEKHN